MKTPATAPATERTITLVYGDDWMAYYVDGELYRECHPSEFWGKELLDWVQGFVPYTVDVAYIDTIWLREQLDGYPQQLSDCDLIEGV